VVNKENSLIMQKQVFFVIFYIVLEKLPQGTAVEDEWSIFKVKFSLYFSITLKNEGMKNS
jgi:hypothetical protein